MSQDAIELLQGNLSGLRADYAAAASRAERIGLAMRTAEAMDFRFDDLDNPGAALELAIGAKPEAMEATIRQLPNTVGMRPDRRAAYLKVRGIL